MKTSQLSVGEALGFRRMHMSREYQIMHHEIKRRMEKADRERVKKEVNRSQKNNQSSSR